MVMSGDMPELLLKNQPTTWSAMNIQFIGNNEKGITKSVFPRSCGAEAIFV